VSGVVLKCERNPRGASGQAICLLCDQWFEMDAAVLVARANDELLGLCRARPSCLNDAGRVRFLDACRRFADDA